MSSVVEFFPLHNELDQARDETPLMAAFVWRPKIPICVEYVSVVVMNEIGGDNDRLLGSDSGREAAFEDTGFIPGDRLHSGVGNTGTLRRERELLQDGEHVRQHRRTGEVGKPETEI